MIIERFLNEVGFLKFMHYPILRDNLVTMVDSYGSVSPRQKLEDGGTHPRIAPGGDRRFGFGSLLSHDGVESPGFKKIGEPASNRLPENS